MLIAMAQTLDLESLLAELSGKKPGKDPGDMTAHLGTGVDDTRPLFSCRQNDASSRTKERPCKLSVARTARSNDSSTSLSGTSAVKLYL